MGAPRKSLTVEAEEKKMKALDYLEEPRVLNTYRRVNQYRPKMREAYQTIQIAETAEAIIAAGGENGSLGFPATWKTLQLLEGALQEAYEANSEAIWRALNHREPEVADVDALRGIRNTDVFKALGLPISGDFSGLKTALRAYLAVRVPIRKEYYLREAELNLVGKKIPGFFPTPAETCDQLLGYLHFPENARVLDPSAGSGRFLEAVQREHGIIGDACEWSNTLADLLTKKGFPIVGDDALSLDGQWDRILMNPPFEKNADVEHVQYAFERNLAPGGSLLAIMSEGAFISSKKPVALFWEKMRPFCVLEERLPKGTFEESGTGVNSRFCIFEKPEQDDELKTAEKPSLVVAGAPITASAASASSGPSMSLALGQILRPEAPPCVPPHEAIDFSGGLSTPPPAVAARSAWSTSDWSPRGKKGKRDELTLDLFGTLDEDSPVTGNRSPVNEEKTAADVMADALIAAYPEVQIDTPEFHRFLLFACGATYQHVADKFRESTQAEVMAFLAEFAKCQKSFSSPGPGWVAYHWSGASKPRVNLEYRESRGAKPHGIAFTGKALYQSIVAALAWQASQVDESATDPVEVVHSGETPSENAPKSGDEKSGGDAEVVHPLPEFPKKGKHERYTLVRYDYSKSRQGYVKTKRPSPSSPDGHIVVGSEVFQTDDPEVAYDHAASASNDYRNDDGLDCIVAVDWQKRDGTAYQSGVGPFFRAGNEIDAKGRQLGEYLGFSAWPIDSEKPFPDALSGLSVYHFDQQQRMDLLRRLGERERIPYEQVKDWDSYVIEKWQTVENAATDVPVTWDAPNIFETSVEFEGTPRPITVWFAPDPDGSYDFDLYCDPETGLSETGYRGEHPRNLDISCYPTPVEFVQSIALARLAERFKKAARTKRITKHRRAVHDASGLTVEPSPGAVKKPKEPTAKEKAAATLNDPYEFDMAPESHALTLSPEEWDCAEKSDGIESDGAFEGFKVLRDGETLSFVVEPGEHVGPSEFMSRVLERYFLAHRIIPEHYYDPAEFDELDAFHFGKHGAPKVGAILFDVLRRGNSSEVRDWVIVETGVKLYRGAEGDSPSTGEQLPVTGDEDFLRSDDEEEEADVADPDGVKDPFADGDEEPAQAESDAPRHMVFTEPVPPPKPASEREAEMRRLNQRAAMFGNDRLAFLGAIKEWIEAAATQRALNTILFRLSRDEDPLFLESVEKDPSCLDVLANMALRGVASRAPEVTPERWRKAIKPSIKFAELITLDDPTGESWKGAENA